jgi:hypothetical protein
MDTSTTLIVINVIISFIHLFDTFINKLKKSTCLGGSLEMRDDNKNDIENQKDIKKLDEELIKQLQALSKPNDLNNNNNLDQNKKDVTFKL